MKSSIEAVEDYIAERNRRIDRLVDSIEKQNLQKINQVLSEAEDSGVPLISPEGLQFDETPMGSTSSKEAHSWVRMELVRSALLHQAIIKWREAYFVNYFKKVYRITLIKEDSEDLARTLAAYEYEIHRSLYPGFTEVYSLIEPQAEGVLLRHMPRLKRLEPSFMYRGLFIDPEKGRELGNYINELTHKLKAFKHFLAYFYEQVASQFREVDYRSAGCLKSMFICCLPPRDSEKSLLSLADKHYAKVQPQELLVQAEMLHESLCKAVKRGEPIAQSYGALAEDAVELEDMSARADQQPLLNQGP